MNQEDIFRLLLIVLLLANRQLADDNDDQSDSDSSDTDDSSFSYTLINDFLILTMITKLFCNPSSQTTATETTF